jgi:hypothetical protein
MVIDYRRTIGLKKFGRDSLSECFSRAYRLQNAVDRFEDNHKRIGERSIVGWGIKAAHAMFEGDSTGHDFEKKRTAVPV